MEVLRNLSLEIKCKFQTKIVSLSWNTLVIKQHGITTNNKH